MSITRNIFDNFFCLRLARFQILFRLICLRIRITNLRSDFLGVQDANNRVSQQCRITNNFFGRSFEKRNCISIAIVYSKYNQKKGRCPKLRHVSRTHHVNLDWLFERSNLDSWHSIGHVVTTEHLANRLTKIAFSTIHLKNLIQVFGIHPPPKLNVDRGFSESSSSTVSPRKPSSDI